MDFWKKEYFLPDEFVQVHWNFLPWCIEGLASNIQATWDWKSILDCICCLTFKNAFSILSKLLSGKWADSFTTLSKQNNIHYHTHCINCHTNIAIHTDILGLCPFIVHCWWLQHDTSCILVAGLVPFVSCVQGLCCHHGHGKTRPQGHLMLMSGHHIRMAEWWKQSGNNCNIERLMNILIIQHFKLSLSYHFATAKLYLNNRNFALNFTNVG